ncbi:MAG: 16S rRNA (guanine(527)-N(7))-methyltransferase RsmG [Gammaproteobacteria bacterium]|nr:16S rRNA (guanine(527)-N(7))-methyltransferase RsmG [Gammaproteobacteria bacterium]|tara:strand:+ start:1227 stop:1826 length:600 start_codon:yes stop_codon:yes gene_type:complete
MQLELSKENENQLRSFSEAVIERNKHHNLTGYKDTLTFFDEQIMDCVVALVACKNALEKHVVDCGSGAGLPSIVWAILEPEITFYSIDKNSKKIQFQKQITEQLGLTNIKMYHTKIENFVLDEPHTVAMKAFGQIKKLASLKQRENQKNLILLKKDNKKTEEELLEAPTLLYDYKKHQYVLNKEKMVALELYDNKNSSN